MSPVSVSLGRNELIYRSFFGYLIPALQSIKTGIPMARTCAGRFKITCSKKGASLEKKKGMQINSQMINADRR